MSLTDVLSGRKHWIIEHAEAIARLRELPDHCIDALVADPPYSSGGMTAADRSRPARNKYSQSGSAVYGPAFDGDNRDQRAFFLWCQLWLTEAHRVLKSGAAACVFSDWRQLPTVTDVLQVSGFVWRGIAVWSKGGAARPQMGRFRNDAEYVVWGSKGPMGRGKDIGVLPGTWTSAPVPMRERVHITQKPVSIMTRAVSICAPGGVVLDPFCGSGSTGVAALRSGRRFIGLDQSSEWADIARDRLGAEDGNVRQAA